jgi:UDP-N-acetylglucosamine 2-epimerase (non-hydrolysing)
MKRPLVIHVVGARPNYMKVAPVYAALDQRGFVDQRLIHTGQHYDESVNGVFFAELPLPQPHVKLAVGSGTHGAQTARALDGLERAFIDLEPDLVVVPGDVNSTLAGALAAVKLDIPVCHLEAGLRSFDWTMPEEHNRRLTDHISSLLLTHSEDAADNLTAEGIARERIVFVGNTMIDSLLRSLDHSSERATHAELGLERRSYLLVTLHRPALVDAADMLTRTVAALEKVGREMPVVFPVHPRTRARMGQLGLSPNGGVRLIEPQSHGDFVSLLAMAAGVITDSGGVQEEATVLGVPCYTLRENTERPVTITHGTNVLLGLEPERITTIPAALDRRTAARIPPLWDGRAGERAAEAVEEFLGCGHAHAHLDPTLPAAV